VTVSRDVKAENGLYDWGGRVRRSKLKESRQFEQTVTTIRRTQAAFSQTTVTGRQPTMAWAFPIMTAVGVGFGIDE
jgi:hypothetical protein